MAYTVGDRVKVIYNDNGDGKYVGRTCTLEGIDQYDPTYPYKLNGIDVWFSDEEIELVTKKGAKKMAMRYYKTLKDGAGLEAGAILTNTAVNSGYKPISDLWNTEAYDKAEEAGMTLATCKYIVENSPEYYQRVYEVTVLGKAKYLAKEAAKEVHAKIHKSKD